MNRNLMPLNPFQDSSPRLRLMTHAVLVLCIALSGCDKPLILEGSNTESPPVPLEHSEIERTGNVFHLHQPTQSAEAAPPSIHFNKAGDRRLGYRSESVETETRLVLESSHQTDASHLRFSFTSLANRPATLTVKVTTASGSFKETLKASHREWGSTSFELDQPFERVVIRNSDRHDFAIAEARLVTATEQAQRENYLLWVIDTLRSDELASYGGDDRIGAFLESLAGNTLRAPSSFSTSAWTRPSTASILTGLYPTFHRANAQRALPPDVPVAAEFFRAAGYSTVAFVRNGNIGALGLGFERGFDRFVSIPGTPEQDVEAQEQVLRWLERNPGERVFIYLHTIVPHTPYLSPEDVRKDFTDPNYQGPVTPQLAKKAHLRDRRLSADDRQHVRNLYRAAVATEAHHFRDTYKALEQRQLLDQFFWVITSDHGEEFYEHGDWEHGKRLWQEQLRVPLFLVLPPKERSPLPTINGPVQGVDVLPTLLARARLKHTMPLHGYDLLQPASTKDRTNRGIYAEEIRHDGNFALYSLQKGDSKIILERRQRSQDSVRFYNLKSDPQEANDLWQAMPPQKQLLQELRGFRAALGTRAFDPVIQPPLSKEQTKQLQNLGYLQ